MYNPFMAKNEETNQIMIRILTVKFVCLGWLKAGKQKDHW
jgi:hypothetical protein